MCLASSIKSQFQPLSAVYHYRWRPGMVAEILWPGASTTSNPPLEYYSTTACYEFDTYRSYLHEAQHRIQNERECNHPLLSPSRFTYILVPRSSGQTRATQSTTGSLKSSTHTPRECSPKVRCPAVVPPHGQTAVWFESIALATTTTATAAAAATTTTTRDTSSLYHQRAPGGRKAGYHANANVSNVAVT